MALSDEEKAKRRAHYAANRERIREARRAAYVLNREKIVAAQKDYAERNKEAISARRRVKYAENRDANRVRARTYYMMNIEARRQYDRGRQAMKNAAQKAYRQDWLEKNPEKVALYAERARKSERYFLYEIRRKCKKAGIDEGAYLKMVLEQENRCAICGTEESETAGPHGTIRSLAIDHDHDSGEVRALLCGMCNKGIGAFHDNTDLMRQAVLYLEAHGR